MLKFLNTDVFQLLTPGPRMGDSGMSPKLAMVGAGHPPVVQELGLTATGSANAAWLNQLLKVRALPERFGLPTINGRTGSPPPVKFTAGDVPIVMVKGEPFSNVVMFEICQS